MIPVERAHGPLNQRFNDDDFVVRYFSLARHALVALFRVLGIGAGARVLLPEYICRDLLASIHAAGAIADYYPVDSRLAPAVGPERWPRADAVIMVNYFGFPQDILPFERYRQSCGSMLIEDNAHGFLSRDADGQWLGLRGDAGLYSLRKTLLIANGAAFSLRRETCRIAPPPLLEEVVVSTPWGMRLRGMLRALPHGRQIAQRAAHLQRAVRRLRTGHEIPPPAADAETKIPGSPHPFVGLQEALAAQDVDAEIARRRAVYEVLCSRAVAAGATPVYSHLPAGTAPYGLPVYTDDAAALEQLAGEFGLDSFRWPDLPDALGATAPSHYRNLHLVNFL
jgi:hypothetical protein